MTIKLQSFIFGTFSFLLLLMINTPLLLKPLKLGLLIIIIMVAMKLISNGKYYINKEIFLIFSINILFACIFIFNGIIYLTENPFALFTATILWPLSWILFIGSLLNINYLNKINSIMYFSIYFISSYIILFILNKLQIIPNWLFISLEISNQSGLYYSHGKMEFSLVVLASLMFLIPYYYSSFIFIKKKSWIQILFLIIISIIFLVSGRRGLQLAVLVSLINIYLFSSFITLKDIRTNIKKTKKYIMSILVISSLIIIPYTIIYNIIDYTYIYNQFLSSFNFSDQDNFSSYTRLLTFNSLIEEWQKFPILGGGYGAHGDIIRNVKMPWSYEITYIALLLQTGLIGILLYSLSIMWIIWQLLLIINSKKEEYIPVAFSTLIAMISFIIASSTNSYLLKFDYLWTIFIPLLVINIYKYNIRKNS